MAVEAHHLHLLPNSQLLRTREVVSSAENHSRLYNDMQMGFLAAPAAGAAAPGAASFLPAMYVPSVPTTTAAAASESGLTFNNIPHVSRKRQRNDSSGGDLRLPPSFLGEEISSHLQKQLLDIDQLILQYAERVRVELMERRRRFARQIAASAETTLAKRLKAKDEEIERIGKLNWALEERMKSLCVENQIWRDVAQSNEAAANVLQANLEQLLAAQAKVKADSDQDRAAAAATADDAESCCCGDNSEDQDVNCADKGTAAAWPAARGMWRSVCWSCREQEPSVLLLPCRHLCLCTACSPAANVCPVCNCSKKGCVHVNMD